MLSGMTAMTGPVRRLRLLLRACRGMRPGRSCFFLPPAALGLARRSSKLRIARRGGLGIIEILQLAALHPFAEHALDAADHGLVLAGDEGKGVARLRSPAGAADPVGVGVGGVGNVVVDDV